MNCSCGVSFMGVLGCLSSLAQSGAITYQTATNPSVARAVVTGQNPSTSVSSSSLLLLAIVGVGAYLLLRK